MLIEDGELSYDVRMGDAIEHMKSMPDASIDVCVTSPPYWKGFEYEAYFNSYKQYLDWTRDWMTEVKRILKPYGTFYLNVSNDTNTTIRAYEIMDIAKELMFKIHDTIIWYRYNQQPANTDRQLTNQTEFVFMFRKTSSNVHLNKELVLKELPELFKTQNVGNVWELSFNSSKSGISFGRKATKSKWGHSGYPIQLPLACIYLSSNEGDLVLDPFMGTGTTGEACVRAKRNFIGVDLMEEYCQCSTDRIMNAIKDKNVKKSVGDIYGY